VALLLVAPASPKSWTTSLLAARTTWQTTNTGTPVRNAPIFPGPDASRPPLATLPAGITVNVLGREGDWYRVVYRDSLFGDRTGYIQAGNLRIEQAAPRAPAPPATVPAAAAQTPASRPAEAGRSATWIDRGYLSLNVTYLGTSNGFTGTTTFTQNVEAGSAITTFEGAHAPVIDIGGAARVWRDLAIGGSVAWSSKEVDGTLSASIPHPFLFNAPRTVTGTVSDVPHDELAVHIDAEWLFPIRRNVDAIVFGGPSFFHLTHGLVTDVTSSSAYPYDTATFVSAAVTSTSGSHAGYNVGLDVAVRMARSFGVGALVRYSHAHVPLPAGSDTELTVRAGGLEVGGGVRFRF
jgi:hypothetical protein